MAVGKETGFIQWEIRNEHKGNQKIEIEVTDNEGAKSLQRYVLIVDFK